MEVYIAYFKVVMEHKKEVFKRCWKKGLKKQAIMHDMSKLRPSEFKAYAQWFKGYRGIVLQDIIDGLSDEVKKEHERVKKEFQEAVQLHYKRNGHHWNHWEFDDNIPMEYLQELVCDWEAVGMRYGNTAQEYYLKNYYQIKINDMNRWRLENLLGFQRIIVDDGRQPFLSNMLIHDIIIWIDDDKFIEQLGYDTNLSIDRRYAYIFADVNNAFKINVRECIKESMNKLNK